MMKRLGMISLAVAAGFSAPSPAFAQSGDPIYRTHMYSDATETQEVGYIWGQCTSRGIQYHLVGTYTYFQEDELVGYCDGGNPGPL
jgi:hypothetical protein